MKYLIIFSLCSFAACAEVPGQDFTGILKGSPTVTLPISGKKVCGGALAWKTTRKSGQKSTSSYPRPKPKYAKDATLFVEGETLKLSGGGTSGFEARGKEWKWSKYREKEVPKFLWGWGGDSDLEALTNPKITHSFIYVTATEKYTDCGESITLRAIRNGNTLELVDKNPTHGRNALVFVGLMFAGFFFLLFLPMAFLIWFVLKRSIRKKKEQEASERTK